MKAMQRTLRLRAQKLIVAGLLLALCGCGGVASDSTATPTPDPSRPSGPGPEGSPTAIPIVELPTPIIDQARLYPTPTVGFDVFKQYPGAKALRDNTGSSGWLLNIEFQTSDEPDAVEAFYRDLALKSGWQKVKPEKCSFARRDVYYYGDYGRQHVYGYYLSFSAATSYGYPKTITEVWISKSSLPIYLGATDVTTEQCSGTDTVLNAVEFTTKASPQAVLGFYRAILPEKEWTLVPPEGSSTPVVMRLDDHERSSDTQLYWRIGQTSHAKVTTEVQGPENTHVRVEYYHGCCG